MAPFRGCCPVPPARKPLSTRALATAPAPQFYSYTANVTGLLRIKVCTTSTTYTPTVAIRTDAFSSAGGGVVQVDGCGSCDAPLT